MLDHSWMWMRLASKKRVRYDFKENLNNFLDYTYAHESSVDRGKIKCPCTNCKNRMYKLRAQVYIDIVKNGFMRGYDRWIAHGEPPEEQVLDEPSIETMPQENIGMERMVMDFPGPELDWNALHEEQRPNRDAKSFFDLLNAAEQPLFEGCETYTKLSDVQYKIRIQYA